MEHNLTANPRRTTAWRRLVLTVLVSGVACGTSTVSADQPPLESKHRMMKECLAKQKASDAGLSKEQMKRNCRDVTKTEHENAKSEQEADKAASAPRN